MHKLCFVLLFHLSGFTLFAQIPKEVYQTTINGWPAGVMSLDSIAAADSFVLQNNSYRILSFQIVIDPKQYGDPFVARINGGEIVFKEQLKALKLDDRIIIDMIRGHDIYGQTIPIAPVVYNITK